MGQYFKWFVKLNDTFYQFIEIYIGEGGMKLLEMAWRVNPYMLRLEKLISKGGLWYKQRLSLEGDYAENVPGCSFNLYQLASGSVQFEYDYEVPRKSIDIITQYIYQNRENKDNYADQNEFQYFVNHDTKQFINKKKIKSDVHPLAILCSYGDNKYKESGKWRFNRLSVENEIPADFTEYVFYEKDFPY
jgi:hypothetical protein